jgi:hypothetical protein
MKSYELPSFPPGNPFHHDYISTGARLRDVVVIDSKFTPEYNDLYIMFSGRTGTGLYIVNAATGERIGIEV